MTPCATCPWRRSSTVGGADIPAFSINLMRNLLCTVGDGDAFRSIMACHGSAIGEEHACVGYLAREGWSNLSVRVAALSGRIDLTAAAEACEDLDLWPDFETMLAAYESAHQGETDDHD